MRRLLSALAALGVWSGVSAVLAAEASLRLLEMPLHDPFLAYEPSHTYYLYTSNNPRLSGTEGVGTMAYKSWDLQQWERPQAVFIVPPTAFAHQGGWAPEVHAYKGRYDLFTTLHDERKKIASPLDAAFPTFVRGTIVAVSDSPDGPFRMLDEKAAVPPADFMTLDGTMEAVPLEADLRKASGPPIHLFKASDAPWLDASLPVDARGLTYTTDGPELFSHARRPPAHALVQLRKRLLRANRRPLEKRRARGAVGTQLDPLVKNDSGHGMLFRTFGGRLMMVLHRPFKKARSKLYKMADRGDHVEVVRERTDLDGDSPRPSATPAP